MVNSISYQCIELKSLLEVNIDIPPANMDKTRDLLGSPVYESPVHRALRPTPLVLNTNDKQFTSDFEPIARANPRPMHKRVKRSIEVSISPCPQSRGSNLPPRSSSCDIINDSPYGPASTGQDSPKTDENDITRSGRFKISVSHSHNPSDFVKISEMCRKSSRFSIEVLEPPKYQENDVQLNPILPNPNVRPVQCDDLIIFS